MSAINKIILGTVQFGMRYGINNSHGKPAESEVFEILDAAYQNGIRMLDTAEAYGNAIELISKYHKRCANRFEVISKFKYAKGLDIESSVNKVIGDLHIDRLYGYIFHSFEDVEKHPELVKKICRMKAAGLVKHIGVSIYTNEQFELVLKMNEFDLIQLPYNLLDNDFQRGRLINKGKQLGKIIHTRSVFLQGLFFKDIESIDVENVLYPLKQNLKELHVLAQNAQISMASLALHYPLSNNNIDGVLFGVDTLTQLEENIRELNVVIKKDIFSDIDRIDVHNKQLLSPINWE